MPAQFQTNYQRIDFDFKRSAYLYSVEISGIKSHIEGVQKEFKVQRPTKIALVDKLAREHKIQHYIYDGDKKFYIPSKLPFDTFEVI